ncbi:hypothetical protein Tco_1056290 [Tanacetum coccineum]|uniref:Uncharacterized protein n=1 Tax=Tanacetum coccineum TaxID=301880 RepID=A0ABQ5H225_9ASTR
MSRYTDQGILMDQICISGGPDLEKVDIVILFSAGCLNSAGSYGVMLLLDIAGWLVSATSHLVSAGSIQSCWWNNVSAA